MNTTSSHATNSAPAGRRHFPSLPASAGLTPARPMRVCIASPEFIGPTRNGGIGTAYTALARTLAAAGHQVTCLYLEGKKTASQDIQYWVNQFKGEGLALAPLPGIKTPATDGPPCLVKSLEAFDWLKKHGPFEVIHFPEWQGSGFHTLTAKHQGLAFAGATICVGLHSMTAWLKTANQEPLSHLAELENDFMERESVALADAVVSPSQYLLNWVAERGWALPDAAYVQQNILLESGRTPSVCAEAREITQLVFFGRLETRKGVSLFCDAVDGLPAQTAKKIQSVTFLGKEAMVEGAPACAYLRQRARKWSCKLEIITDYCQTQALEYLRQKNRLAVIPSLLENSPYTVLECLGAGISFVASRVGGIPELIAPDDVARVCFETKAAALTASLCAALTEGFSPARAAVDARANQQAWVAWHHHLPAGALPPALPQAAPPVWPKVSLCLTTFNRPALLRQALASVKAVNYPKFEVILVDDGSTHPDAIAALDLLELDFAQRGWRIVRQENRYLGAARNTAARHAIGEFLLFMDDDNFAEPAEISTLVKVALKTGADIVTCGMNYFSGQAAPDTTAPAKNRWLPLGGCAALGAFRNCFGDANALVRRACFESLGGFTEDYGVTHEDWEFHAKAVLKGFKLTVVPEFLFWYRVNPTSMIRTTSNYRNHMRGIRPYLDAVPEALRHLVLYAQGQHLRMGQMAAQGAFNSLETRLSVAWRSKLEAAKVFAAQKQTETAIRLLIEAVKSVETCQHPLIILETLLCVGQEMRPLDRARATTLFNLGLELAKAIHHEAGQQTATEFLASLSGAPAPAAVPAAAAPSKAAAPAKAPARSQPAPALSQPLLVSIIIPTFNKLELTRQCLAALQAATPGGRHEIIMVDNGSTDGTPAFLQAAQAAGTLRAVLNRENTGFAKACNQGARAAQGKYVLFLNNDTEVRDGWLEPLISVAESDPRVAARGGKLLYPDGSIQHAGVALAETQEGDPLMGFHLFAREKSDFAPANQPRICQAVTGACLLARKALFDQAGGFDEGFYNGYEDVDLCLRWQERGYVNVYEPASVVTHHESQSGPERFKRVGENIRRFHGKWLGRARPDVSIDKNGKAALSSSSPARLYTPPSARPPVSIILLAHNQIADTRLCLASIEEHTALAHELILVDNGSTDGTSEFFRQYASERSHVRVILNRENLGFAAGNNQGLAIARGENLLLLNNDTVVTEGWLERMLDVFQRHPNAGLAGPVSNSVSGPQRIQAGYSRLEDLPRFAAEWSAAHAGESTEAARLVGFCLLLRRAVLERIGGLDPQYGSGNFEDDDWCIRAGLAGFAMRIAWDCFVHHTGGQTFKGAKIDYRASMLRNWELFKAKWAMPKDAPLEKGYRFPDALPSGVSLSIALPELPGTHAPSLEGRCWTDLSAAAPRTAARAKRANKPVSIQLPPCALIGRLTGAREQFRQKKFQAAWEATLAAIQARPFHPEGWLLLGEIAQAVGDGASAILCGKQARLLAPDWKPAKKFLNGSLHGVIKPAWLVLPPAISAVLTQATPRLSICLIVKNEEKFLGQCLASACVLASQIVVVDTGSTDRTVEIAKEHGAEVHHFPWNDDFAAARNAALERATGDWVLALDADEELMPDQAQTLVQEMQTAGVMAFRLPIIDKGREEEGCSYVPRLFRNAPGLFFLGRVHEQAFSSIEVRCQEWGLRHVLGKSALLHHGYVKEVMQSRDKIARNLRLLKLALEELPGEPNLLMSLGLELVRSGEREAGLPHYWEAVELLGAKPAAQIVPELRETLLSQLATHLMAARDFAGVARLFQTPLAKTGGLSASHHFSLGLACMELKQPAEAAEQMRQCLAKRSQPALSPVNKEILKGGPSHCLAICLGALQQKDAAARAFADALRDEPSSRRVRLDFARFQAGNGQPLEALKLLNDLTAENPSEAAVWQLGGQIALSRVEFLEFARDWTGEAQKHFPDHSSIVLQRAEALLLTQDVNNALPLWRKAHSPNSPGQTAALVLCEFLAGEYSREFTPADEVLVSREFLQWYRRLIAAGAHSSVNLLHERMDQVRAVLPGFVRTWEAATKQAREALAAA